MVSENKAFILNFLQKIPKTFVFSISERIEIFVIKICKLYIFHFQNPGGHGFPTTPN